MHRQKNSTHLSETRLKEDEMKDIWDLFHHAAYVFISYDAFVAMVLKCPPVVKLKGFNQTEELDFLLRMYYKPFLKDVCKWFKCFGICPWYKKKLRGTAHYIPVIPKFGAGHITTFIRDKGEQGFKYYWKDSFEADEKMYFEVSGHPPDLDGSIRAPMAALLADWRTLRIIREATETVTYSQAHQQHVFEFHPPKNQVGDDALESLEQFGDKIAGTVMYRQEALRSAKMNVRADDLRQSLMESSAYNRGQRKEKEFQGANLLDVGTILPPDYTYKTVPSPSVHASLEELSKRIDRVSSMLMDIPITLLESMGGKNTANIQGSLRIVNERIKDWTTIFSEVTQRVFLILYGNVIQESLDANKLLVDTQIQVYLPCTPIASADDIKALPLEGYMNKQTAGEHLFNILGLPFDDLEVTKPTAQSLPTQKAKKSSSIFSV